jgi:hypothetical protein
MIVFVLVCYLCRPECVELWRLNYETMEDCTTAQYLLSRTGAAGMQNELACVEETKT